MSGASQRRRTSSDLAHLVLHRVDKFGEFAVEVEVNREIKVTLQFKKLSLLSRDNINKKHRKQINANIN